MTAIEIGKIISSRRADLGLKQEDVAEMAGVNPKTIYAIENGKGNPSFESLQKVSEVLGMELLVNIKKVDA
ncbi:MAG: helix-turn-helix domain-containing protein [Bacteroidota bacterium]